MNPPTINAKLLNVLNKPQNNKDSSKIDENKVDDKPDIIENKTIALDKIKIRDSNIIAQMPPSEYDSNKYKYKIKEILSANEPKNKKSRLVNLCIYNILKTEGQAPVLLYLLYKDTVNNKVYFPYFNNSSNLLEDIKKRLHIIFKHITCNTYISGYKEDDENDELYVFIEIKFQYSVPKLDKTDKWWWTSITEIINHNSVLGCPIDDSVIQLFFRNPTLLVLFNENNNKILPPDIGYITFDEKILSFILTIGLPRLNNDNKLGPYYYFSTYEEVSDSLNQKLKDEKKVIFRVALHTKKTNYIVNNDYKNWTHGYNSIYYKNEDNIEYGIKEYNQHNILSYHL